MSPHHGVVLDSVRPLSADEKRELLSSLAERLPLEVVPSGQPVTRMCHDDSLVAAPGVTLRKSAGESHSERAGR